MKSLNKMLLMMFVLCAIPWLSYGDDAQINELRNRVELLQKQVKTMNQTLTQMMDILNGLSSVSSSQPSVTPNQLKWEDRQNWRKLRSGMSKDEVRDLLGEPDNIDKYTFYEDWLYGVPPHGMVKFSSEEKLDSWHEPR